MVERKLAVPVGGLVGVDGRQLVADPIEERHKRERLERIASKAGKSGEELAQAQAQVEATARGETPGEAEAEDAPPGGAVKSDSEVADAIRSLAERQMKARSEHLEMFAAAYLKQAPPGLQPGDAMLIETHVGSAIHWFFAPRNVPTMPREAYELVLAIVENAARNGGRDPFAVKAREIAPLLRRNLEQVDAQLAAQAERQRQFVERQQAALAEAADQGAADDKQGAQAARLAEHLEALAGHLADKPQT